MSIKEQLLQSFKNFYTFLEERCVSNLTSTSDTLPLSASQGKELNDRIEKLVPIGYIFTWNNVNVQSTRQLENVPDLTTAQNVHNYFGFGIWERITNVFLYSGDPTSGGGNSTVTLNVANLPSHTHGIPSLSGSTGGGGNHVHHLFYNSDANTSSGKSSRVAGNGKNTSGDPIMTESGNHTHSVTTNSSTSNATGSGSSFSIMPPYKGVYMWQRIA